MGVGTVTGEKQEDEGYSSTSPVPALQQEHLSQHSLGAALHQHSSAIQTHLYKQIQIQLPWQRSSRELGLLKFVFCNYFSLLCFFSGFYAKLHGWRVKLCLDLGCDLFWVVPLLEQILNHVIQSPF